MADPQGPLNLLSLDGGGIRGVCEVLVLQTIMYRLQRRLNRSEEPRPCDYFHLIGGTSTGGLISLMLSRFRMTATECMEEYTSLSKRVFSKPKTTLGVPSSKGMFSAKTLETVVQELAGQRGGQRNATIVVKEKPSMGRGFVTALASSNFQSPTLLRTYISDVDVPIDCTVWEASRATTAAPTFFKSIEIKRQGGRTTTFIDAGIKLNNPLATVLKEAQQCFGSERRVQCILSLGTGHLGVIGMENNRAVYGLALVESLKQLATDCNAVHDQYAERFQDRENLYFRFNLEHGAEKIALADWKDINTLSDHVDSYLRQVNTSKCIDAVVELLCNTSNTGPLPSLSSINLVPVKSLLKLEPFETHTPGVCSNFVPRPDISAKMHTFLRSHIDPGQQTSTQWLLLYGLPGSGKTQLCRQLFDEARNSVVGRFWVDASTEETIEEDYHSIAKTAGLGERDCLQVVTRWLTKLSDEGTPWLLVLDNFGLKRRVEDFLPRQHTNNSCVIVTSIKKLEGPTHDDELGPLEVGPLPLKDASQLLLRAVGKENVNSIEWDACRKLVTKLGFLPLAIAVAGAHIRNNQYSLVKYLGRWQFVFSRTSSDCGKLTRSVDATLQISYNHLMASNGSDQANDLLHFFTFLHTESTSTSPLRMAWKSAHVLAVEQDVEWNSSPLNVLKAFAAQHILEPEKQFEESIRSALSLLRSYSLLQWNGSEAVQLHSLVGNWVLYRLKGANLQFWWTATATTLAMSLSSESSIEYKRSLLPHLDHLFDIQPTTLKSSLFNIHASSKRDDFEAAFRFADVYAISGYFEKALEIRKEIWSQVGREGSLDASELATSDAQLLRQLRVKTLELLAASYGDKGNHHEALGCRQRAILLEVESAPSRRSFSENYLKLKLDEAESLRLLGHEEQASAIRTHIKHELERHPQTTPEFRLRVLRVSREIELGILHQKSNQQALGRLEHLVAEHGALVEKDDHDLLTARSELSRCYSEAGYEKKALIERLDILAIRRSESDIHHDTLVAMQDVANSYSCLERKDEALGMRGSIMRILDSDETGIVESHPTFLSAKFNWARSLFDNGEVESALLAHKQVLALRQQCEQLGAGTRDTIMSMEEVAQSLFQLACDQPPSTHRLLEALSIRQDIVRMTGKSTASTETSRPWLKAKTMLAIYYHDLAKFHGAALEMLHLPSEIGRTPMDVLIYASKCLYQVFLHQRETLGESDGDTLQTMTELGIAKFRMAGCDTSNKTSHYEEALRWFQGVDLHATRDIPCNIQNLGYIVTTYKKLHRLRDAIHTLERLLQLQGETLGTDAVGTKQTARKLWEEYRSRKDDTSAQTRADSLYERYVADGMQEELKD